jgi:HSP20 family protein
MMIRFDPWREFDRVLEELRGRRTVHGMPLFGYRRNGSFVVEFDLPGVNPDSLEVTVEKDLLTVRAERPAAPPEGGELVVCERPVGTFERQVYLSDALDREHLVARYDRGVLAVTIPVREQAKPHKIEITLGEEPKVIETPTTEAAEPVAA